MSKRPVPYRIADFRHRVAVCTMEDVVETNGTMTLTRKPAYNAWAHINPVRLSMFSRENYAIMQPDGERSHDIVIRQRPDIDLSSAAWLYEERLKSGSRWFKVLRMVAYEENGEYWRIDALLSERGTNANRPVEAKPTDRLPNIVMPLPHGVRL